MSWLNLNDSLSNLKGQISNFASNVLADEFQENSNISSSDVEELQRICSNQQEEINKLNSLNAELQQKFSSSNGAPNTWIWDVAHNPHEKTISDLKLQLNTVENEKKELLANLELLDSDFQQNTEKLARIKDKLQDDYNELEDKYVQLQEESTKNCTNCERLSKIEDQVKRFESENKKLLGELEKAAEDAAKREKKRTIDEENLGKLAKILEGYEQEVSALKKELKSGGTDEKVRKLEEEVKLSREENNRAHAKYVNILTENMKKYMDPDRESNFGNNNNLDLDPQFSEFSHQVESILNILLDFKSKCQSFERDLFNVTQEKSDLVAEKNHEIEKLMQNSEILSQEVLTKTQIMKDYESECCELIKNNDLLIKELEGYKNSTGLQTISESNEDNLLLLETQLDHANKRIEDLEQKITSQEDEDDNIIQLEAAQEENESLVAALERNRIDLENAEYQTAEMNINVETMKEEIEELTRKLFNSEKMYMECERNGEQLRTELNSIREKVLFEEDGRKQAEAEVKNLTEQLQNAKILETSSKLQYDTILEELSGEKDAKVLLENSLKTTLDTLQKCQEQFNILQEESDGLKLSLKEKDSDQLETVDLTTETEIETLSKTVKDHLETITNLERTISELSTAKNELTNVLNTKHHENVAYYKAQVKKLTEQLQNAKILETSSKLQYDTILEELSGEKDAKVVLENSLKTTLDTLQKCQEQFNILQEESNGLKLSLKEKDSDQLETVDLTTETAIETLSKTVKDHLETITNLERTISELNTAKNELTNVLNTKHHENVTYYNEIQRLSQIITGEVQKSHNLELQLQANQSNSEEIRKREETLEKLTDQNNFLRQKCEVMAENLLQEQTRNQQILAERSLPSEKEQTLNRNLERLQAHIIELEEHYTQELLKTEEKNGELQAKVNEIEQREKSSSTMYTSVNIRANQHVETLQNQLQLITNQRDELRKRISDAEDQSSKQMAALANLQFVLEQFQADRENDIQQETERIRRQIAVEKAIQEELRKEIGSLQEQLLESKQGLQAAVRLSDQLEQSKQSSVALRGEVAQLTEKLAKSDAQIKTLTNNTDGKVDKSLIKNLVVGFVSANNNLNKDQTQILKIIATVLDFNQQDHDKVDLNKPQHGWLGSLLLPQSTQGMSQETLSQAFVKFLEKESKPRLVPSLLNNTEESTSNSRKSSTSTAPRNSPIVLSEIVLPTFADFAQNRNSSSILKDVLKDNS